MIGSKLEAIKAEYKDVPTLMAEARRQTRPQASKVITTPTWLWGVGSIGLILACLIGLGLFSLSNWLNTNPTPTLIASALATETLINLSEGTSTLPSSETPTSANISRSTQTPVPPYPLQLIPQYLRPPLIHYRLQHLRLPLH